jgi:hypothetical protein
MRSLILIFLFSFQAALAQQKCAALFSAKNPAKKYSSGQEVESQISSLLSQLPEKTLDYILAGAHAVKVFDLKAFKESSNSLQLALAAINGKGLSVFKGDIYISHYYYNKYAAPYAKGRKIPLDKFSLTEPWFKWNEETRTYSFETSNIVENIVNKVFGSEKSIKIYRGTNQSELRFMEDLTKMPDESASLIAQKKIKGGSFHGYFFTNDKTAAQSWSKDETVVSVDIPREVVLQLAREGRIYAGVEGNYFEFMFFDPATIKSLASLYQIEK